MSSSYTDVFVVKNPLAKQVQFLGWEDLLEMRSSKEDGNPPQCSCLGNPMDRGAWRATVHGVANRHYLTTEQQNYPCYRWAVKHLNTVGLKGITHRSSGDCFPL